MKNQSRNKYLKSGINLVDQMKGVEFEKLLKAHFEKMGYSVKLTNASNDYGADLLLRKGTYCIAVQAKRYSPKVGIKAVQEIASSLNHYGASKGIVVTNSYYTKNAIELAKTNSIELWDRDKLLDVMNNNNLKVVADNIITSTIDDGVCPECKNKLLIKKSNYGEFYGCSNYPKCSFTRNV